MPSSRRLHSLALGCVARCVALFFGCAAFLGCATGAPDDAGHAHEGCVDGWQERVLPPHDDRIEERAPSGDLSCAADVDVESAWVVADVGCIDRTQLVGRALDPHLRYAFGGVNFEFYFRDVVDGFPDVSRLTNEDGTLSNVLVPTCQPITYVATGDPDTALPTSRQHAVFPPNDTSDVDLEFLSGAAVGFYASSVGKSVALGRGSLFGRVRGCDDGPVAGVHIVVRDGDCRSVTDDGGAIGYTRGSPYGIGDATLLSTTEDGGYFAVNVRSGRYVVDVFETLASGSRKIGSAPVEITGDTVSLVDVRIGRSDGNALPAACARCE